MSYDSDELRLKNTAYKATIGAMRSLGIYYSHPWYDDLRAHGLYTAIRIVRQRNANDLAISMHWLTISVRTYIAAEWKYMRRSEYRYRPISLLSGTDDELYLASRTREYLSRPLYIIHSTASIRIGSDSGWTHYRYPTWSGRRYVDTMGCVAIRRLADNAVTRGMQRIRRQTGSVS